jgi:signal transduction histidine kinase
MTEAAPHTALDPQLEVLQGLCHEFGSSDDLCDVTASAVRWIQAAVGDDASVRVSVADRAGRLRTLAESGTLARGGRKSSTRRRHALESQTPVLLDREPGTVVAVLPLICRGESVGVLEVVASQRLMAERGGTIGAVASQLAMAVWNLRGRESLERQVESLTSATDLVRELVGAETFEAATRAAMKLSFRLLRAPVAGWVRNGDARHLRFIGVRGVGTQKREELRKMLPKVNRWESSGPAERARITDRFRNVMGVTGVRVIDGGDAVILAGGDADSAAASLGVVGSLFQEVLQQLSTVARAEQRNRQLDLGIAWTAHEVREPLLAAKAAIDQLLRSNDPLAGQDLLSRSGQELGELAALVDALLRWSVGGGSLRRTPVDLVSVVSQAVDASRLGSGEDRLDLDAPEAVPIRADAGQLRSAVANVIRNALAYSPGDSRVTVRVSRRDGMAVVSVADHGPGIPAGDREALFEPFARGPSGRGRREGRGLGLFIARRVVEAHGGVIWAESTNGRGATFRIQVPVAGNGHRRRSGVEEQGFSPELTNR